LNRILVDSCQPKNKTKGGYEHSVTVIAMVGGTSLWGILLARDGVLDFVQKARHGDGSVNVGEIWVV